MTLYKQLVVGMISVFILLMAAVFVVEFNTTRKNLETQQRSEVNNTINTVGLALAPYLKEGDRVAVESVINALFDGSSYSTVKLNFLDSDEEILRNYPIVAKNVPDWFINLGLFQKIKDKRIVTSGWLQLAEVEIVSHPGNSYKLLWEAFTNLLTAFAVVFVIGMFAIAFIVRSALTPLRLITEKMQSIAHNQFGEPLEKPKTTDLIPVVDGINTMSAQVEKAFKEQAREAQQLRESAYIDPVSKLGNRAFYMSQLNQWVIESASGGIAVLEAGFIRDEYDENGYESGDKFVRLLSEQLSSNINLSGITIARMSAYEFGFILPNYAEDDLKNIAENIINCVNGVYLDPTGIAVPNLALGMVANTTKRTSTEILSLVDNALSTAKSQPDLPYSFIASNDEGKTLGKRQWKALVEEAVHNDWVKFRFQSAKNNDNEIYHREVFSSIEKDGERFTANQYMFALEQLEATHIFDQHVIESMIKQLVDKSIDHCVAINLSQTSISQPSFIRWLTQILNKHNAISNLLHFEIPESSFIQDPHYTALVCNAIRGSKASFGVDNYGRNFQSLDYINEYRPNYVKLDYLYTHSLDDEKQRFTLTSISRAAHNLGITTIASRVETEEQLQVLAENYVEVFQGFIVDK